MMTFEEAYEQARKNYMSLPEQLNENETSFFIATDYLLFRPRLFNETTPLQFSCSGIKKQIKFDNEMTTELIEVSSQRFWRSFIKSIW